MRRRRNHGNNLQAELVDVDVAEDVHLWLGWEVRVGVDVRPQRRVVRAQRFINRRLLRRRQPMLPGEDQHAVLIQLPLQLAQLRRRQRMAQVDVGDPPAELRRLDRGEDDHAPVIAAAVDRRHGGVTFFF